MSAVHFQNTNFWSTKPNLAINSSQQSSKSSKSSIWTSSLITMHSIPESDNREQKIIQEISPQGGKEKQEHTHLSLLSHAPFLLFVVLRAQRYLSQLLSLEPLSSLANSASVVLLFCSRMSGSGCNFYVLNSKFVPQLDLILMPI